METYSNFTTAYAHLVRDLVENYDHESSPRGMKIREKLGVGFRIEDPRNRLPYVAARKLSISYLLAELTWYITGSNSTKWISNYAPFWASISDDGETANSAYGARIFKPHDRIAASISPLWTQWQYVIDELKSDPDSRRAVVHIRSPQDSLLAKKDVPCTLTLQFFLRDGKLHQVASMRSSDIILGLSYDVPAFTLFQEMLALELGVELGTYTHVSNSLHIYERHFAMGEQIVRDAFKAQCWYYPTNVKPMPVMPCKPPTYDLMLFENKIRTSEVDTQLVDTVSEAYDKVYDQSLDRYWMDWLLVLASHRATKLGLVEMANDYKNSTVFEGFHFFEK